MGVEAAAAGIILVVNAAMARALAHVSVEQGHDPREFALVPFGGAGPMHACELAEALDMRAIMLPRYPGVLSAFGMTLADQTRDYRRSVLQSVSALDDRALAGLLAPLEAQARTEAPAGAALQRQVDLRYAGQSFELTVPADQGLAAALSAFHALHERRYGYGRPERPVEVVTLRLRSLLPGTTELPAPHFESGPAQAGEARVWFPDGWRTAPVLRRARLHPGAEVRGPTLLVQDDATAIVAPGWAGAVDRAGNLLLQRTNDT